MKRLFIILLGFLMTFQTVSAQEQGTEIENRLNFKLAPFSLMQNMHRVRFGVEYISDSKLGYGIDVGLGSYDTYVMPFNNHEFGDDYLFYEIRPEIKYLTINKKYFFTYSAVEFFYMQMNSTMRNGVYQERGIGPSHSYEKAYLEGQKYGGHIKFGINIIAGNFNFDFYTGIGLAKQVFEYSEVTLNPTPSYIDNDYNAFKPYLQEQNKLIANFDLGFKIGYTILKK